jgi:PleD family two-component response regulator
MTPEQLQNCGDPHCIGPTRLTLSIAVGQILPGDDAASLRERLSAALWKAKGAGRDRVLAVPGA